MYRRDALRRLVAAGMGTAVVPAWVERLLASAQVDADHRRHQAAEPRTNEWTPKALTAHQNATVMAIAELIIPETDTPGASAARVHEFVDAVIDDAAEAERREFLGGLAWIDARSRELFGAGFVGSTPAQQTALLTVLSSDRNTTSADRPGVDFFKAIKGLTITGYYSSEVGMREELGDDGTVIFADDPGCQHPEHQKA